MIQSGLPVVWIRTYGLAAYKDSLAADIDLNAGPPPTKDLPRLMALYKLAIESEYGVA